MPERIQLRRTKGWRKPDGVVVVARPSKWGNPWKVGAPHPVHGRPLSRQEAVDLYALHLGPMGNLESLGVDALVELAGKDLACWCPEAEPCHADALLVWANAGTR